MKKLGSIIKHRGAVVGIALLFWLVVAVAATVYHWRPLIRTDSISVEYEESGSSPRKGTAYSMLFRPEWVFVSLPLAGEGRRDWFAVDFGRKVVAFASGTGSGPPYLHFNHDKAMGVAIDFRVKVSEEWVVVWQDDGVRFSTDEMEVRVTRR